MISLFLLSVSRSVRDWDNQCRQRYEYTLDYGLEGGKVRQQQVLRMPCQTHDSIVWKLMAPSGTKMVVLKKATTTTTAGKAAPPALVLELWMDDHGLVQRIELSPKIHGAIINDPTGFGVPVWSPDEQYLLYSAERASVSVLEPPLSSFWDRPKKADATTNTNTNTNNGASSHNHDNDNNKQPEQQRGGQNVLHQGQMEGWGEKYVGQSPLLDLFLLQLDGNTVHDDDIDDIEEDVDDVDDDSRNHSQRMPIPQRITNVPGTTTTTTTTTSTEHGVTLGQAIFDPGDGQSQSQSIVYTGWDAGALGSMPRRLGFLFCRNRPSKIYRSSIQSLLLNKKHTQQAETTLPLSAATTNVDDESSSTSFTCLTPDHALSRSPQFATIHGKSHLIMLSNPKGFHSHDGGMGLYRYDESTQSMVAIVEVVEEPYSTDTTDTDTTDGPKVAGMGFPGLFLSHLPPSCGQLDNFVFLSTIWGSMVKIIRIDLRTTLDGSRSGSNGNSCVVSLVDLQVETDTHGGQGQEEEDSTTTTTTTLKSQSILCGTPEGGWIVSEMALNQPARILHIPGDGGNSSVLTQDGRVVLVQAKVVAELPPIACTSFSSVQQKKSPSSLNHLELISILPSRVQGASDTPIQSLLMWPKKKMVDKNKKIPLVVVPHGGPHSCSTSSYSPGTAFLCDSGYAVLFPNYRGSIGFGQASVESLLTRVGSLDVQDVMAATNHVLETMSDTLDASRVGICGGSHGGFLTGHCTGQYPDFFKAAVMRNPVTNIATMTTATDIVDWCYTEVFGTYHSHTFRGPKADELSVMWSKSPVAHESHVKTPTMIALGMVDLRVPPSQGLEWYHSLRSRGVPTKLLVYPEDSHALDKVTTEADHWIHIKQWFDEHL
jgi:acylaminoacyl-peptidase